MHLLNYNINYSSKEIQEFFEQEQNLLTSQELMLKNITFQSKEEALDYLEDILKIYKAVSITYFEPLQNFDESDIYKELVDKLNNSIKNYIEFPESMIKKLSEQKSSSKSCSHCRSSINRDYFIKKTDIRLNNIIEESEKLNLNTEDFFYFKMKVIFCPICEDEKFVITETDESKLNSLKNKVNEAEKKLKEEELSFQIKSGQKRIGLIAYSDTVEESNSL